MKYVYDTPEKFYDALKDNIDDEFPIESFEKIEKDVNNKKWYGARASYVIDRSDVSEELDRMFSDYDVDYRASGFLFKKVTVTIHSKGKSLTSMFSNLITKPEKNCPAISTRRRRIYLPSRYRIRSSRRTAPMWEVPQHGICRIWTR